jgi:hypothetical protein
MIYKFQSLYDFKKSNPDCVMVLYQASVQRAEQIMPDEFTICNCQKIEFYNPKNELIEVFRIIRKGVTEYETVKEKNAKLFQHADDYLAVYIPLVKGAAWR